MLLPAAELRRLDWQYVCRTASSIRVTACGLSFLLGTLARAGELLTVTPAWMTTEQYGPVSMPALWEVAEQEPIYLVTNVADLDGAVQLYKKRPHIETFFSNLKSRGFQIHKSHLSDPARLCWLLIACCLAYLWIVYPGACAMREEWMKQLHRQDRCDLSLFRLGLQLLACCLKEHIPIPDGFLVPVSLPMPLIRTFAKKVA